MSALSFKTPTPFLRGRTYYFRLRVPQDLLPVYDPKKELTFSLKTRDFHQALENARLRAIQLDQEFREHRRRLAEQQAIASVLSDMDAEIEALEARRDKVRHIKAGMMQELLTGKTRLISSGERA